MIDLKTRFGKKYRVRVGPCYQAETGSSTNSNRDPWQWELLGSRGHLCPWGGDLLAVCLNPGHPLLAKKLMSQPWVIRSKSQFGDFGEVNAVFDVADIQSALPYIKPYARRQVVLTDEQRAELSKRMLGLRAELNARPGV